MARIKQISERTMRILEERTNGKSIGLIAQLYGISRQRVWAILKASGDPLPKNMQQKRTPDFELG
jgi:hypothetical protein